MNGSFFYRNEQPQVYINLIKKFQNHYSNALYAGGHKISHLHWTHTDQFYAFRSKKHFGYSYTEDSENVLWYRCGYATAIL